MRTNTRACLGNPLRWMRLFAVVGMAFALCAPPAAAQSYTAELGPAGGLYEFWGTTVCSNAPPRYVYYTSSSLPTQFFVTFILVGRNPAVSHWDVWDPLDWYLDAIVLNPQFVQENGIWRPASAAMFDGINGPDGFIVTTLDANGRLKTYESDTAGDGAKEVRTEAIDLQTGEWTYVDFYDRAGAFEDLTGVCDSRVIERLTETIKITGSFPMRLIPVAVQGSLATLNPYYCATKGYNCTAVPSSATGPDEVTSAPAASAISADGHSAAVIAIRSNDATDPVEVTLTGPSGFSGAIGSLSLYDPNFLSEQPSGTTSLTVGSPDFCDEQGNCIFLALLWAPATMSGGIASPAGGYAPVPLTVTTSQAASNPMQTTIELQPPPLVLVHGIWGKPTDWSLFEQWLGMNYPHNLIFPADYSRINFLAFSDPKIQNIMEETIANALACANVGVPVNMTSSCLSEGGVVARTVDVVGHSMGGLVTRYYMNNPPPYATSYMAGNPVHQLITVGTPHLGSPLASTLWQNRGTVAIPAYISPTVAVLCSALSSCTVQGLFAKLGRPVSTGVLSLVPGQQQLGSQVYNSIVGQAPDPSETGILLNLLLNAFMPGSTIDGILGTPNDTIVAANSQSAGATSSETIAGVVHASVCENWSLLGVPLCADTGETGSQDVWSQAVSWLMGGSGPVAVRSSSAAALVRGGVALRPQPLAATPSNQAPVLDLTGYTQIPDTNVTWSPASGSTLTIGSVTNIAATSSSKTITELLLFQYPSDPTDVLLTYSTQAPFSIPFTPTRLGSTSFTGFAVFDDSTFAVTNLNYPFQASGNPLTLNLVNVPVASLPVGASAIVGAQALFSNGYVDVSQVATYKARSGATSVFGVDSTGLVTANGPGNDWLDVSYNGVSASAQISVGTCEYSLSPTNQLVYYSGGSLTVQVTTQDGCGWTADTGTAAWLTATNASGTGSGTITLDAAANTTGFAQTAIVTAANRDVVVTQPATACSYVLNETSANIPAAGGSGTDGVTTSCPIVPVSNASWLTAAASSNSIVFSALANTTGAARSATITLDTQELQVTQASLVGTNTTLAASPNPAIVGQTITLSATVAAQGSASGTPTGSVAFFDGSTAIGNGTLNGSGQAALTTSSLAQGSHLMTGSYSGDSNFAPSASPVLTEIINNAAPNASLSQASVTFGSVDVGTSAPAQAVTLSNNGAATLNITSIAIAGSDNEDFSQSNNCGSSVAAGSNCKINVVFTPSATGTRSANLTITDNAANSPQTVSLTGTGTPAVPVAGVSPSSLTFGNQPVGATSTAQPLTLSNTGTAALTITSIATSANFGQTNNCGSSVAANGSCTINVTFSPTATGPLTGTLTITDNSNGAVGSTQTVTLTGTGTGTAVSLSATSLNFGAQPVGSSSMKTVTLTNLGSTPLSISSLRVVSFAPLAPKGRKAEDFAILSSSTCTAGSGVAGLGSCTINVVFKPTAVRICSATLVIADSDPSSPQTVSLRGTGMGVRPSAISSRSGS